MSLFAPNIKKLTAKGDIPGLVEALHYRGLSEKGSMIRYDAAQALGWLKDVRAVEPLIMKLREEDEMVYVRTAAICALGELSDARAVEPLITTLKDKKANLHPAAAEMLGKLNDKRAVEPLITMLKNESILVRQAAAKSLGELKDTRAIELLLITLNDEYAGVREAAACALGELNDARAEEGYVRRCLEFVYREEQETRTFQTDPAFADILVPLNAQQYAQAIKEGQDILPRFPDFDLIYKWMGSAYRNNDEPLRSHDILSEGIRKAKRKCLLLSDMGETEWQLRRINEAVYWWSQALHCLSSNPIDYNAYLLLSYVAKGLGLTEFEGLLLARVDSMKSGQVRLDPTTAESLLKLVKDKKTEAMKKTLLKELQAKYF
jgi:hypothetical protein